MRVFTQYYSVGKKRVITFAVFGGCLSVVVFFSLFIFSPSYSYTRLYFLPNSSYLEAITPGLKSLLSDAFYIQAILSLSDRFDSYRKKVRWIQRIFALSLVLDPKMEDNYFFAGVVVGNDPPSLKAGIKFLKKYQYLNPDDWRIPYWIGFDYYLLGDFLSAIRYYQRASLFKSAPSFLKSIQPMLYYKAGKIKLGIVFLEGLLSQAKNKRDIRWIRKKLLWLKNINYLQERKEEFQALFGRPPHSIEEMKEKGIIAHIPSDPFGKGYYLDKDGCIKSRF